MALWASVKDGFEVVCEEVVVLLPLVVDDFLRRDPKRVGVALYAEANEPL